jgi:hypothetical protein
LHDDRRIRIREAQKHVDPDPEHWSVVRIRIRIWLRILSFSHKCGERTEIMFAKLKF